MGEWDIGFSGYQKGDSCLRLMEFSVRMFCFHFTLACDKRTSRNTNICAVSLIDFYRIKDK